MHNIIILKWTKFPYCAVGTATSYGLDGRAVGVRVPVEAGFFPAPHRPDRFWGLPSLQPNGYWGLFPLAESDWVLKLTTRLQVVPKSVGRVNYRWFSPAQSFLVPSATGLTTVCCCLTTIRVVQLCADVTNMWIYIHFCIRLHGVVLDWKYPCNRPWRPIGLWEVEDPTFSRQSTHRWGDVVILTRRSPLYPPPPQENFWYFFYVRGWINPRAISAAGRIRSTEKSIDLTGIRTHDLSAW
jgi:hypothetical protein